MRAAAIAEALDEIIGLDALGLCLIGEDGRVVARDGALARWAPAEGEDFFAHPLMGGFRAPALALREAGGRLDLPGLGFDCDGVALRIDLAFFWTRDRARLIALCLSSSERHALEGALAQSRREQRILAERVAAQERKLAENRRLMQLFIEHMPAAVAMLDADQRFLFVSRRWREDLRLRDMDVEGRGFVECLPLLARRWARPLSIARAGEEPRAAIGRVRHADGGLDWMSWAMIPWRNDEGAPAGVLIACERVTEAVEQRRALARQRERLRDANLDLQRFSVAMSHDLQAPVRQIAIFARLIDEDSRDALPEKGQKFLDEIAAATQRMQAMIQSLLRYMRIASREPAFAAVRLNEPVDAARRNLAVDIEAMGARLEIGALPQIDGDADLLCSLFQNLIENALKYASAAPLVVSIETLAGTIPRIAFADNGPGIPPAEREGAFQLFRRLSRDRHRAGQGAGLALCRRIVELHGGTIEIDPECERGLRFVIEFPQRAKKKPS